MNILRATLVGALALAVEVEDSEVDLVVMVEALVVEVDQGVVMGVG